MSQNLAHRPTRPLLWLMDKLPALEKRPTLRLKPFPDEMTHEQTNPLLAQWSINAHLTSTGYAVRHSIDLLDDTAVRDTGSDENPLVFKTAQATLVLEKALLRFEADWDRVASQSPARRAVLLSIHRITPQMLLEMEEGVCSNFLSALHGSEHRLLAAWEETQAADQDLTEGVMCTPVTPAVALALLMALQSEEAFAKVVTCAPAGLMESMLDLMSGDAMLALDWLVETMERLLVAGLRPDGPRWRDEIALVDNATAIMTHWLVRVHQGEVNPLPPVDRDGLPHNSMVAGATAAVFIAAASRFIVRAKQAKLRGNYQRTVHDAWLVYKHVVNLSWLPPPLEQRILSTLTSEAPDAYTHLREHARSLRVPRLNATLFADWLGLVLAWLGVVPAPASKLGS